MPTSEAKVRSARGGVEKRVVFKMWLSGRNVSILVARGGFFNQEITQSRGSCCRGYSSRALVGA